MSDEIQAGLEDTDSAVEVVNESPVESTDNSSSNEPTISPAWQGFLDTIPSEYVPQATPILQEWDKNFQNVQLENAKYKPYEEFISHDPEMLRQSIQLANLIQNDPRAIFDRIGQHHGYLNEEAGQGELDEEDPLAFEDPDEEPQFDISEHPEFQHLQQQQEMLTNYYEEQEAAKQTQAADEFISNQFSEITKLHGQELNENEKQTLSNLALGAMQNTGKLDLVAAYGQYSSLVSNARNTSANNSIPSVVGGMGNIPVKPLKYDAENFESSMEAKLKALGLGN